MFKEKMNQIKMKPGKINLPKEIKEIITAPIPKDAIKEKPGAKGKTVSYISGVMVTDILDRAFGYNWDWIPEEHWITKSEPFVNEYSKNEKTVFNSKGKPAGLDPQGPVAHVKGTLIVRFVDDYGIERIIKKGGYGAQVIVGKQNEQESAFKSADTDALKKAASRLGIGAELYRKEEEEILYESLNYEDPWTEELQEKYKEEREYIKKFMNKHGFNYDEMGEAVDGFSDGEYNSLDDINPEIIEAFVEFLKQTEKKIKKELEENTDDDEKDDEDDEEEEEEE